MTRVVVEAKEAINYLVNTYPGKNLQYVSQRTGSAVIGVYVNALVQVINETHKAKRQIITKHPIPVVRDRLVESHDITIHESTEVLKYILARFYGWNKQISGMDMFEFFKTFTKH